MGDTSKKPITKFKGLNNVADPFRLSPDWAVQADNVDISRTSGLQRCKGFTKRTANTSITGAYATYDQTRCYVVDSGELRHMYLDLTYRVLKTGLSTTLPVYFEEVNSTVYYTNGLDFGIIEPQGWRPWGVPVPSVSPNLNFVTGDLPFGTNLALCTYVDDRGMESGNSEQIAQITGAGQLDLTNIPQLAGYTTNVYVTMCNGSVYYLLKEKAPTAITYTSETVLGRELPYWNVDVPRGTILEFCQGRMWAAELYPQYDFTVLWGSLPLQFHHFKYDREGIIVPGRVRMVESAGDTLIIGTDRQIWSYDGDKMTEEAPYGVVDGFHPALVEDTLFFWTLRGLCSAMPFKNLTEDKLYVAPGLTAGAAVLEKDGMRRYVVALRSGGQPYNRR